ncbi:uncharacterized protein V1518DRAFT_412823 [Limtongia smithiae]|uniref:uncharacterized protein n=1 Tax=Limtongia smithiae TaxID=1125753 RepID=UPI0034CE3146
MKPRRSKPQRSIRAKIPERRGITGKIRKSAKTQRQHQHPKPAGGNPMKAESYSAKPVQFYRSGDDILLVGEGDLSFTCALLQRPHSVPPSKITATVYDAREEVLAKYPDTATENIHFLETYIGGGTVGGDEEDNDDSSNEFTFSAGIDENEVGEKKEKLASESVKLLFKVDATALNRTKHVRTRKFGSIVFNFPHTGSGMTDQDRNVRQNQELLVGFLKSAIPLLTPTGIIVITLFEGLPYSLWNLRGLAKALDLETVRSGKFVWTNFKGYMHRRTSGVGETTKKQDERDARMFVFQKKTKNRDTSSEGGKGAIVKGKKGRASQPKRKRESSDDESE